jgi:hypothetical protein
MWLCRDGICASLRHCPFPSLSPRLENSIQTAATHQRGTKPRAKAWSTTIPFLLHRRRHLLILHLLGRGSIVSTLLLSRRGSILLWRRSVIRLRLGRAIVAGVVAAGRRTVLAWRGAVLCLRRVLGSAVLWGRLQLSSATHREGWEWWHSLRLWDLLPS